MHQQIEGQVLELGSDSWSFFEAGAEVLSIHWFTPQMATGARSFEVSQVGAGAQALQPSSAAFPDTSRELD